MNPFPSANCRVQVCISSVQPRPRRDLDLYDSSVIAHGPGGGGARDQYGRMADSFSRSMS